MVGGRASAKEKISETTSTAVFELHLVLLVLLMITQLKAVKSNIGTFELRDESFQFVFCRSVCI